MGRLTISRYRNERIILTEGDAQVIITLTRVAYATEKVWLKIQHSRHEHPCQMALTSADDLDIEVGASTVTVRLERIFEDMLTRLTLVAPGSVKIRWVPPCSS